MASYAPGPSTPSEMPIAPRVMRPDTFQSIGAPLVETLRGADVALGSVIATVAPIAAVELGPQFEHDVTPAIAALEDFVGADSSGTIDKIIAAVDSVVGDVA